MLIFLSNQFDKEKERKITEERERQERDPER